MQPFSYRNPVKVVFGKDCLKYLKKDLADVGSTVLLVYGGGSIKRNGAYDAVTAALNEAGKTTVELSGIMANPRTTKVEEGLALCRAHKVDFILAVGGGSVIDCSKAIAAAAALPEGEEASYWDTYFVGGKSVKAALPLGTVLTMAATGSEMNQGCVVTHWEGQRKLSAHGPALFPKFSYLDPVFTYSLPKEQLVYGIVDMLSHLMEQYFSTPDESNVTDDLIEAVFKSITANAAVALERPDDYIARSNLMWNATLALNGLLSLGKRTDWMTHQLEHAVSAFTDLPHGAGLAIIHPMYLTYVYKNCLPRFTRFATNVWGIDPTQKTDEELALAGIAALRSYFKSIGAPTTFTEVGITEDLLPAMAETSNRYPTAYSDFTTEDILAVYKSCL